MNSENKTKKKRVRPKTKGERLELQQAIEEAILSHSSSISDLFDVPSQKVLLSVILKKLDYDQDRLSALNGHHYRSISKNSRVFEIVGGDGQDLFVVIKPGAKENLDDKIVYVDNLPFSCTEDQLKRRASLFGTVVDVNFPQVKKLQRRVCPGVRFPLNSGFGFVQFTSKTAAKKFCRFYLGNSHLNRTHHPKTHKKKSRACEKESEEASPEKEKMLESPSKPLLKTAINNTISGRKRRMTDISLSEMSGVEDSGGESDVPFKKQKMEANGDNQEGKKEKSKRRRKRKSEVPKMSLAIFFSKIQVFSYGRYKKLKSEYLQLKKESEEKLKGILKVPESIKTPNENKNGPNGPRGDFNQLTPAKKTKKLPKRRSRPRSRSTRLKTAAQIKDTSFLTFQSQTDS